MAVTGSIPLSKIQGALESTRGTAIAATRVLPILSGTLTQHMEETQIVEQRASLFRHYYAPVKTRRWVEIDLEIVPTEQDLIWYLQLGLIGHATPGTALAATIVDTTVDRYSFTPSASQGLTQTATLEVGDDTQAYIATMMVCDRLEFGWSLGGPMTLRAHFMGAKAVQGAYTPALTAKGTEIWNGAVAQAFIHSATIGAGPATAPSSQTFTLDNNIELFWTPNGTIIPSDFYHRESRTMHLESAIRHTDDVENAAFLAQTQRKIRTIIAGSSISGSAGSFRCVQVDWYGYWSDAPFADADGLWTQTMSGDAVFDATATFPFKVIVDTDTATIA